MLLLDLFQQLTTNLSQIEVSPSFLGHRERALFDRNFMNRLNDSICTWQFD